MTAPTLPQVLPKYSFTNTKNFSPLIKKNMKNIKYERRDESQIKSNF